MILYSFSLITIPQKPEGEDDLKWHVGPEPLDFNIKCFNMKFKYYLNKSLFAQIFHRLFLLPVNKNLTKMLGII